MRNLITSFAFFLATTCVVNAAEIKVFAGGSAFQGGPAFDVFVGAQKVGSAELPDPVPKDAKEFSFTVADELLSGDTPIEIRFTNDKSEKGKGDRNLKIYSVNLGKTQVYRTSFKILEDGKDTGRKDGSLNSGKDVAVVSPPNGTWFKQTATSAKSCLTAPIDVIGFANGVTALTVAQKNFLMKFAGLQGCSMSVTGYSSLSGDASINKELAKQRAQAVGAYLSAKGMKPKSLKIVGFGETDKFGKSLNENRRVVITFQ
jgi:outer membrane protein OmpA-like peptidoglycan-associated protein